VGRLLATSSTWCDVTTSVLAALQVFYIATRFGERLSPPPRKLFAHLAGLDLQVDVPAFFSYDAEGVGSGPCLGHQLQQGIDMEMAHGIRT
jgi:hypothetical protein